MFCIAYVWLCLNMIAPSIASDISLGVADVPAQQPIVEGRVQEEPKPVQEEPMRVQKEPIVLEVSAYTLAAEECNKPSSDPAYGITASGEYVSKWRTVAAGSAYSFGTLIYIPYFKDYPNGGVFRVEDRGGYISDERLDVYMESTVEANHFGRKDLKCYIITEEEFKDGSYKTKCGSHVE